jgi:uncharacterized protein YdeI (BOF family)
MKFRYLLVLAVFALSSGMSMAERIGPGDGGMNVNRNNFNNNNNNNNNNGGWNGNGGTNYIVAPYNVGQPVVNQPMTTIQGPNGTTQTQIGNTTYYSPGASSVTNGNKTIYSDGTNCVVQGNKRVCN